MLNLIDIGVFSAETFNVFRALEISEEKMELIGEKVNGPPTTENHAPAKEHLSFHITPWSLGPKGSS